MAGEWRGDHPFYLVIRNPERGGVVIDLDSAWLTEHADLLRAPGVWHLMHKETMTVAMVVVVNEGDQPFCKTKHVGFASGGAGEVTAYGMGKHRADGKDEAVWVFPGGIICGGDDVEPVGIMMLKGG